MDTEQLYTYILTAFEGKSFENLILNKRYYVLKIRQDTSPGTNPGMRNPRRNMAPPVSDFERC